jgi:hypothetical protein
MSGTRWQAYIDKLQQAAGLHQLSWKPDDPLVEAEVQRQLMMNLSLGYFCYFGADPSYPDFIPFLNSVYLLQPNPDDVYLNAFIDGKSGCRIYGERGSIHLLTLTVGVNMMGTTEARGRQLFEMDLDTATGPDGMIDLVLSTEKPAEHTGAWRHLPAEAEFALIRQRSYRWGEERDARLAITPLRMDALKPRLQINEIERRTEGMLGFTERMTRFWLNYLQSIKDKPLHEIRMTTFDGGVRAQRYWEGIFDLAPDEALILETPVPEKARYWNVQLNDLIWNTVEYVYRQSSLNGAQASIDPDGHFRAVISEADPGIANWLDTGGNNTGTLVGRWYECDSHPLPALTKVKFADIRQHLPADTRFLSVDERATAIRQRAQGAQLRRRW